MLNDLFLSDAEVVVEKEEKLTFHQVDLGEREESTVLLPVHVLGTRVVEVFGGTDEDSEEDSVARARQTGRELGKLVLQLVEIDEGD